MPTNDQAPVPTAICCGLSTVDIQLNACDVPLTLEHITKFSHTTSTAGGSSAQTALALSSLGVPVAVSTAIGPDTYGQSLITQLSERHINTSAIVVDKSSCTALAILPLFVDGRRGCFVTLGANLSTSASALYARALSEGLLSSSLLVFHFGYPHLMPSFQASDLDFFFRVVRVTARNCVISLDVNGASLPEDEHHVLLPALQSVSIIHANLEEACVISGRADVGQCDELTVVQIQPVVQWFVEQGVEIACVTYGKHGVFVATCDSLRLTSDLKHRVEMSSTTNLFLHRSAFEISEGVEVNASGAGDAFIAGILAQLAHPQVEPVSLDQLIDSGLCSALRRIDPTIMSSHASASINEVLAETQRRKRITPRQSLLLDTLSSTVSS